jgi:hypothetical protein
MRWSDQVITRHPGLSPSAKRKMLRENALRLRPRVRA